MSKTRTITLEGGGERLTLEVNPTELSFSRSTGMMKQELLTVGEYAEPTRRGLLSATISTFLPGSNSPFKSAGRTQADTLRLLMRWQEEGETLRLTVPGVSTVSCFISSFSKSALEGDMDVPISLELTQRRTLREKAAAAGRAVEEARRGELKKPSEYTVKAGDNLSRIAKLIYGDSAKWRDIYEANQSVIGSNPNLIRPGQELVLP